MDEITSFRDEYACLSNFYGCAIKIYDEVFSNSEAAFQSQKDLTKVKEFTTLGAKASKMFGKKVQLREDWEQVKDQIMYDVLLAKFSQHEDLAEILLSTGDAQLVEGNTWHDNYWGACSCARCQNKTGQNKLGESLMKVREELRRNSNGQSPTE